MAPKTGQPLLLRSSESVRSPKSSRDSLPSMCKAVAEISARLGQWLQPDEVAGARDVECVGDDDDVDLVVFTEDAETRDARQRRDGSRRLQAVCRSAGDA